MFTRIRFLSSVAIVLMGLVSVVGCSKLPTQPSAIDVSGAAATVMIDVLPDGSPSDQGPAPEDRTVTSASSRVTVHGHTGGTVAAGDFQVIVPARAFNGNATITVTQRDVTKPVVELSISPPSKNQFKLPVTLIANASKVDGAQLSATCLSWYDPATITWTPVASSAVTSPGPTVRASITHFSTYRLENNGTVGW